MDTCDGPRDPLTRALRKLGKLCRIVREAAARPRTAKLVPVSGVVGRVVVTPLGGSSPIEEYIF